ncbi:MAG: hypothetical protein ABI197_04550 [Granulicella sp.]
MFLSIDALCQEFGLDNSKSNQDLAEELIQRRVRSHPDKTGGAFASKQAESTFHRLSEAISYLQSSNQNGLQSYESIEIRNLTIKVANLQTSIEKHCIGNFSEQKIDFEIKQQISRSFRTIQIGSATFAAISGSVIALSGKLSSNPVLSPLLSLLVVKIALLFVLCISCLAFLYSWVNEQRLKGLTDFLLSADGLATVVYWCTNSGRDEETKLQITKRQIAQKIMDIGEPWTKSKFIRRIKKFFAIQVSSQFAYQIAEAQLTKLLERNVITKDGIKGIDPLYQIEQSRAEEIAQDRYLHYHPQFWGLFG